MQRANQLNGADFSSSSYAAEALQRLNTGDWTGFEPRDLHCALTALADAFRYRAQNHNLPASAPEWSELRDCLHALSDVLAGKWLEAGENVFREKLAYYHRKSRTMRPPGTDELLYQAAARLDSRRHGGIANET